MKPKLKTIAYWVTTALVGLDFIAGGLANLARVPEAVAGMTHFGYPAYFTPLLGLWKVLGGIVILAPRLPRLKEWAYAGIVFDVVAAAVSIVAVGDGLAGASIPVVFGALTLVSWKLRPTSRTLAPTAAATAPTSDAIVSTPDTSPIAV